MLHKKRKPSTFTSSSGNYEGHITTSKTKLHSKSTYFYRWLPIFCSLALLLGLGIIFNPTASTTNLAHAETVTANPTDYSSISLTISNNGTELNSGDTVSTNVEPGLISYISNNLKIDTKKINRFYVSVQAAEDGSSELTGTNNHATVAPVGSNKVPTATDDNGFGDNTWGFALGEANIANESLSYNSLPAYGTSTTPQYSSATNLADGTYNLKLTFAAKINADKPSDHYTTKAMVSVAADAKSIATLGGITKMSQMTSAYCKNLPTPSATAELKDVPTGQLIDDREGENGTKYWVSKLADGNCWMTQNMAYSNISNKSGNYNEADKDMILNGSSAEAIGTRTPSKNPLATDAFPDANTYNTHFIIGNYYTQANNQAADACNFSSKSNDAWKLPTSPSTGTPNDSFRALTNAYGATSGTSGNGNSNANLIKAPLFFLCAGAYNSKLNINGGGYYWSSNNGSSLFFYSSSVVPADNSNSYFGQSVRCLVSGE